MDKRELSEDKQLAADLNDTVRTLEDGLRHDEPRSWWLHQRAIIHEQHQRVRELRRKYLHRPG